MEQGFFESFIKRSNNSLLKTNVVLIVIILILFVFSFNNFYNMFAGPTKVSTEEIVKLSETGNYKGKYITISNSAVVDSGIEGFIKFKNSNAKGVSYKKYLLMHMGNNEFMVIETERNQSGTTFTGRLTAIDKEVNELLAQSAADAGVKVLPLMLDATYEYTFWYILLALLLICIVIGVLNITKYIKRNKDPMHHPVYITLSEFGEVNSVAMAIENELGQAHLVIKSFILTKGWCIHLNVFSLELTKIENIKGVYMQTLRNKQKITYKVILVLKNGKQIFDIFPATEQQSAYRLMDAIKEKNPAVQLGEN